MKLIDRITSWFTTDKTPPVPASPLAQTIPQTPDWMDPKKCVEIRIKTTPDKLKDEQVMEVLADLRATSTTRLAPNKARHVQHGQNMQQVRKKIVERHHASFERLADTPPAILSDGQFDGASLVNLMRK